MYHLSIVDLEPLSHRVLCRHDAISDYLKTNHFAADELMEKSFKVKFSSSVQLLPWRLISFTRPTLIYRLSEDAAYTQKTLGDNGSLGTQKNIEGTNI